MGDPIFRLKLLASLALFLFGVALLGLVALGSERLGYRRLARWERLLMRGAFGAIGVGVLCFLYGTLIEANWIEITYQELRTPKLRRGERIRIVQVSDLHVDHLDHVLRELPEVVNAQKPDLFVFTGDSLNSAKGLPVFQEVLRRIQAPLGRYGVKGNHDIGTWRQLDLFGGGTLVELRGANPTVLDGGRLALCGAPYGIRLQLPDCLRRAPPGAVTIVAYHSPDLVEDLAPLKPDLYLAGHTHGGQVRVPWYGAVVTFSRFDKKYEMGRYRVGDTTLYVNRGLGFEPGMPRVRFLARPEVAVIDLVGG